MNLQSAIYAFMVVAAAARPIWHTSDSHVGLESRETLEEAAGHLRTLVYNSNLLSLNTIDDQGYPVGQVEYYADCGLENAELAFVRLNISSAYRNIAGGSLSSLSVRLGDVTPHGRVPYSPASQPRASLYGSFSPVRDEDEIEKLTKCFLKQHPDAEAWLPGNQIHDGEWVKYDINKIYYIGGFGNVAYIGDIPIDLYKQQKAKKLHSKHGKGHHGEKHHGRRPHGRRPPTSSSEDLPGQYSGSTHRFLDHFNCGGHNGDHQRSSWVSRLISFDFARKFFGSVERDEDHHRDSSPHIGKTKPHKPHADRPNADKFTEFSNAETETDVESEVDQDSRSKSNQLLVQDSTSFLEMLRNGFRW